MQSATVVNSTLVPDPTTLLLGFNLALCHWLLLNRFPTGKKYDLIDKKLRVCGEIQTMAHVNSFPLTKLVGGIRYCVYIQQTTLPLTD